MCRSLHTHAAGACMPRCRRVRMLPAHAGSPERCGMMHAPHSCPQTPPFGLIHTLSSSWTASGACGRGGARATGSRACACTGMPLAEPSQRAGPTCRLCPMHGLLHRLQAPWHAALRCSAALARAACRRACAPPMLPPTGGAAAASLARSFVKALPILRCLERREGREWALRGPLPDADHAWPLAQPLPLPGTAGCCRNCTRPMTWASARAGQPAAGGRGGRGCTGPGPRSRVATAACVHTPGCS